MQQGDKHSRNIAASVAPVFGFKIDGDLPEQQDTREMHGARSPALVIIPPAFQYQGGSYTTAATTAGKGHDTGPEVGEDEVILKRDGTPIGDASTPKPIRQTAENERRNVARLNNGPGEGPESDSDEASQSSFTTMSELQMSMVGGPTDPAPPPRSPKHKSPLSLQTPTKIPQSKPAPQPAYSAARPSDADQASVPAGPSHAAYGADKKKPELTKAERRAIQEAQRAAKASGLPRGSQPQPKAPPPAPSSVKAHESKMSGATPVKSVSLPRNNSSDTFRSDFSTPVNLVVNPGGSTGGALPSAPKPSSRRPAPSLASTELFSHLPQYKAVSVASLLASHTSSKSLHPAVLQLGLKLADGTISGANARCMAMLHTLCQVIQDYSTPPGKSLNRDLTQHIGTIITFLVECRPLSVSMGNAIKHLKLRLSKLDPSLPEAEAKEALITGIADIVNMRIRLAGQEITNMTVKKVVDGDVVMTYAYSHVVCSTLVEAAALGQARFKVLVVDSRPEQEGKLMMQKLLEAGLSVSFVHINAISYAIREATKVFLGAAAIMHNGTVVGRAGTAAVAMVAHEHRKPVLVLSESYKFHERVQLDSITHNELGDPEALATVSGRPDVKDLAQSKASDAEVANSKRPCLLNLKYDAMPAEYVTTIVCEFGMIPPTSVPVILRECNKVD